MIKAKIRSKINFPSFAVLQDDLDNIAQRIIIPDIQKGIHAGEAINGGNLPQNEPATIMRKGDNRPLIETGRLLGSFLSIRKGKSTVIVTIGPERKEIARHLQIEGIQSKIGKKFYKFFGISKDAETITITFMKRRIAEAIQNAR